jgi:hypothetical protein
MRTDASGAETYVEKTSSLIEADRLGFSATRYGEKTLIARLKVEKEAKE